MKRSAIILFVSCIISLPFASSCAMDESYSMTEQVPGPEINAMQETAGKTKTILTTDAEGAGTISWLPQERINIFFNKSSAEYTSTNASAATTAVFTTSDMVTVAELNSDNIWGLYPYDSQAQCDGSSVTTTIVSEQRGREESFDTDLFPLLAHSSNTDLAFYNVCGGIKFSLTRDDIYKIEFKGNGNESLAGKVKLSMPSSGRPRAEVQEGKTEITLKPKEGTTFKKDSYYYIICLPVELRQGFTVTFYTVTGKKATYSRTEPVSVARAVFLKKSNIDESAALWEDNPEFTGGKRSGLYLGITGFNQDIYEYPVTRLNEVTINDFYSFVNGLEMKNGTLLCYGVDKSLTRLQDAVFPDDLCAVAAVTFTDGLDQGSVMMNPAYSSDESYLVAVGDRIRHEKYSGHNLLAYSVGLRGSDVSDVDKFRSNLTKLASSSNNAFEVSSMNEVKTRLQAIAKNVTDISYLYDITLQIPGQSEGARIRFTFDNVKDAANSQAYIEGTFSLSDRSLKEVTYNGLTATSGSTIRGTVDGIFVKYSFATVKKMAGGTISPGDIDQWGLIPSTGKWQINSEFDSNQNVAVDVKKQSVAVMLILDCSSSLGSQYSTMLSNARSFIYELQQASYDPYAVSSISLNATSKTVTMGNTFKLTAQVTPDSARNKDVIWISGDPSVATVDQEGSVNTIAPGNTIITATTSDGGYTATCTVKVNPIYASYITLNKTSVTLNEGDTETLIATVKPDNATGKSVTWTSSNEAVAAVDSTGRITALSKGTATIRATANDGSGKYASCSVTVEKPVTAINLDKTSITVYSGKTEKITATVTPSDASNTGVRWESSNTSVATVSTTGVVTGKSKGNVVITATAKDGSEAKASCEVVVLQSVTGITLNKTSVTLNEGDTEALMATITPDDAIDKGVTWTSSNESVATVDANGKVTAISKGTATIRATANDGSGKYASCSVSVCIAINGHFLVDLGLPSGLKWATCNVGAKAPEEYGDYFAWGETEPYYSSQDPLTWKTGKSAGYNWASYKFELGTGYEGPFSKYVTISSYGTVDNKTVLDPEDDAAHANWGGSWRMPTDAEWTELWTECTWTWTRQNGVDGRLVTGPNGNSIFLPAAGYRRDIRLSDTGSDGGYWSSSLNTDLPGSAWYVFFYSGSGSRYGNYSRYLGRSVRPVSE